LTACIQPPENHRKTNPARHSGDLESVVLTFFPHPRMVLQEQSEIRLINTIEERTLLLAKTGLDNLIIHPFDKAFSRLTAEEFVQKFFRPLNIGKIVIGHDHRFGRNRTADINDLIAFGQQYDFEVEQISPRKSMRCLSVLLKSVRRSNTATSAWPMTIWVMTIS
jgi:riboflavin kinase/FMN adenylyltransferase